MVFLLINILFLNHLVSCFWFYIARFQDFDPDTWVARSGVLEKDTFSRYVAGKNKTKNIQLKKKNI